MDSASGATCTRSFADSRGPITLRRVAARSRSRKVTNSKRRRDGVNTKGSADEAQNDDVVSMHFCALDAIQHRRGGRRRTSDAKHGGSLSDRSARCYLVGEHGMRQTVEVDEGIKAKWRKRGSQRRVVEASWPFDAMT
ncbi:hypothetical protein H257_06079 [Aphanomyces astaci]|uniref:Uncharacterized protein n=1 Tax=Aphanomyces astaci TaxID=112090 RepID=W4GPL4_APHAT|nr:hypothetical protein H257_06079 [Aphanomyces astaci]ETV81632.1 hypothetical protein H257_06079 [Aphanomyces astaci]|eukprot:XP_009829490.1 hypothetical protein H257_06079 [Aphanomyces astaci]